MKISTKEKRILLGLCSIIVLLIVITKSIAYYNWYNDPFRPFTENEKNQIESQKSPEPLKIAGTYVWEGTRKIDYGLEAHEKVTLTINNDGTCTSEEYTLESNDTRIFNLQWFIVRDNKICFGRFNVPNPDMQTPGAQFFGNVVSDGIQVDDHYYKRIN
jgi:hypothetical protein